MKSHFVKEVDFLEARKDVVQQHSKYLLVFNSKKKNKKSAKSYEKINIKKSIFLLRRNKQTAKKRTNLAGWKKAK